MLEWFNKLSEGWQTAIFGAAVAVGLTVIGGIIKYSWPKKDRTSRKPDDTHTAPTSPPPPDAHIIHNLPYGSIGKLLKGRTKPLQKLQKQLAAAKPAAITQPATIHGLGGVGKTRLAVEYALRSLNDKTYTAALFVTADSVFSLNTNLAALASPNLLNLPEFNQPDQGIIVEAVISTLSRRTDWLLILDNVDDDPTRQHICAELLPRLITGRLLITSRLSNWPPDIADLPVTKLNTKDAASYLRSSTKAKRAETKRDNNLSEQLAETLDGLPVALEQAAAYIKRTHITFTKYMEEFEKSRAQTLARYEQLVGYDSPVLFTWSSTQARLTPVAHCILRLASFLAPEPIPTALFESQTDSLTKAIDILRQEEFHQEIQPLDSGLDLREALAELADWSMINLAHDSFTVHRLVQDAVRLTIPSDLQKSWTELALNIVGGYIPDEPEPQDVRSWPLWVAVEPHVTCIIQKAASFNIPEPTGWLMNSLGLYLQQRVRFDEAEYLVRRVLALNEELLGHTHTTVAACLNNLAQLYQATNRLKEAEPLMLRALKIDEASLGKDHPEVAIELNNLAQLYNATNRLKEAEPLMQRALKIDEVSQGKDHPDVAMDLNNLAELLRETRRFEAAEPMYKRVLEIWGKSLGKDHPQVAIALNNLAMLYRDTNRLKEAEPLMERHLVIFLQFTRRTGHPHPHLDTAIKNYTALLMQLGHTQDQITARLKRLAPEIFQSPDNQPKEN
ncbi:MAG: tetratricopeptide repeat protein [Planctomycetota bacterium]|jgi:tetratricopeptide (TPR) repeat protein